MSGDWKNKFLFIAHRGASMYAPENTIASFRKALEMNADAIEFDVRRSRDGIPVVIHDEDLKRVANDSRKVAELTVEELKKVKVFGKEAIPTLEEVLQELDGKTVLFIEVKDEDIEEAVVNLVKQYNVIDNSIIISFNSNILKKIKELNNKIEVGILTARPPVTIYIDHALKLKAMAVLPMHSFVTPQVIKEAHAKKLRVYTWTINDVSQALKFIGYGVDGIATDDPTLKINVQKQTTLMRFIK
jgi:glycerophosphoryl diester phosphodiesterase